MNGIRIKICGITRPEDALLCEKLVVDMIGFNFVPSSPRYLDDEELMTELTYAGENVTRVGVFADADPMFIRVRVSAMHLDIVQLHGSEDLPFALSLNLPIIKAFRSVPPLQELVSFLDAGIEVMLDGKGGGMTAAWDDVATLPQNIRSQIILAGGLTPVNVSEAIEKIYPLGVDIASGVESAPGVKDAKLVREFVSVVRNSHPSSPLRVTPISLQPQP